MTVLSNFAWSLVLSPLVVGCVSWCWRRRRTRSDIDLDGRWRRERWGRQ